MTSVTHLDFLPTIWAESTRNAIEYEMVLSSPSVINTQYEADMAIGRVLRIPLRANYNTQTKTEGVGNTINFQSQVGTAGAVAAGTTPANAQSVTVSTFEYAAALLNSVVAAQSKYDERERIAHGLGYALNRGIEVGTAALAQSFSQIQGTLGADPDDTIMRRSWQYLRDAGVTEDARWFLGPAAVAALLGNDKFTSRDFVDGASKIERASLGPLYGFPVIVSNLLRAPAAGQTECYLAHREAIILIRQTLPTVREQFLIRNIADGIVAYDLYTVAEAAWPQEAPAGDNDPTVGDYGAVLIRTS